MHLHIIGRSSLILHRQRRVKFLAICSICGGSIVAALWITIGAMITQGKSNAQVVAAIIDNVTAGLAPDMPCIIAIQRAAESFDFVVTRGDGGNEVLVASGEFDEATLNISPRATHESAFPWVLAPNRGRNSSRRGDDRTGCRRPRPRNGPETSRASYQTKTSSMMSRWEWRTALNPTMAPPFCGRLEYITAGSQEMKQ